MPVPLMHIPSPISCALTLLKALICFGLLMLAGCDIPPTNANAPIKTPEKPRPFQETQARENLTKLVFTDPIKGDDINPNAQNYASAIRLWMEENPDKRIVTLLGIPTFDTRPGIAAVWMTTKFSQGPKQRVVQLDLPTELPEEYTIATLLFSNGQPSGILALTQAPDPTE